MKSLHISTSDRRGGAGRAAYRINNSLKEIGVNSKMLVLSKHLDNQDIIQFGSSRIQKILQKIRRHYEKFQINNYKNRKSETFSIANHGLNISNLDLIIDADIINVHWINRCFLSLKSIKQIGKLKKAIVWTLHDMWAFTGGCHYSGDCRRYEKICGKCDVLGSSKIRDLSWKILSQKLKVFRDLNLTIIAPSSWLSDCVKKSALFRNHKVEVIPNPVDTEIFKPIDKKKARQILNLSDKKFLVLFGLSPGVSLERKGINYLIEALLMLNHKLPDFSNNIELMVLGLSYSEQIHNIPFKTHFLGSMSSDHDINLCYNAADFFISPSLEETFGLTFIESMSCGTPCITFNHGGPADIVNHMKNGYLAEYKSSEDLLKGIRWILEDKNRLIRLGKNAREKVLNNYTYEIVGKKYSRLYESLLKK
jgi:glycosyltransferase involved in cell wall biosynthesis